MSHNNHNPYAKATGAYGMAAAVTDQRVLEGQVLLQSAQKLEALAKRLGTGERVAPEEIGDTLTHNRKLWELFLDGMMDPGHLLPQEIKNNVASLAVYVFKRTNEVLIDTVPEKIQVLIDINRNIAAGLMKPSMVQPAARIEPSAKPASGLMTTDSMA